MDVDESQGNRVRLCRSIGNDYIALSKCIKKGLTETVSPFTTSEIMLDVYLLQCLMGRKR